MTWYDWLAVGFGWLLVSVPFAVLVGLVCSGRLTVEGTQEQPPW